MSTSLLYHAFGIKDYIYSKTEYKKGKVILVHPDLEYFFVLWLFLIDKIFCLIGLCFTILIFYYAERYNKTGL